jgi:ATP-dependent Lon protease
MFIATANMMDQIPYPLYDRLEIVHLSGYSDQEKLAIAREFLIPKNLKEYNLTKKQFTISDELLLEIIDEYTKEAGVRQLERIIAKLMRKTIQLVLKNEKLKSYTVTKPVVLEWLGNSTHKKTSMSQKEERIGLATGLAWTEVGGDVLEIETSVLTGKGGLTLTGQLGDVMQESAQAAMSYIRSRAKDLGLKQNFYSANDIHLHIPEGATPKDGPSAGITIGVALVSVLTNNPTKPKLAMTGEITLQGRILSIGGLKEKLLAAKQHGCMTVIIPQENSDDIQDIKKEMSLDDLTIHLVSSMDEVLKLAFVKDPFDNKPARKNISEGETAARKKQSVSKKPMKKKPAKK